VLAGPSLVAAGALRGDTTMTRVGLFGCVTALAAFEALVARYHRPLYHFAYRLLGHGE